MRFYIRLIMALCLMFWGHFAFAAYIFKVEGSSGFVQSGPFSSFSALKAANSSQWLYGPGNDQYFARMTCNRNASSNNISGCPFNSYFFYVSRVGTCEAPNVTNPETGECEAPLPDECEAKNGESTTFTKSGTAPDSYAVVLPGGTLGQDTSACFSGCVVSTSDQKCKVNGIGNYTCQGKAYYTGQKCTTGPEVDYTDSPKEPEPETITKDKPCQYIEQADGTLRCDSEKSTEKEGQSCGTVNGVKKCYDTKPTKNGIDIKTEVKTETKPDGSTTTTKKDTATKTTCSGINSCTSTTTTTTTTTDKDANGKVNSVSGICTGAACPDKNTNPDGDGDGFGDCVGGDCSSTGGGPVGSPELEEVPGFAETTSTFTGRIAAAPIMTAINGIRLNGSGSCSMTGTTTMIGSVDASAFCDNSSWLDSLYYVFLAIHALAAVRVFLSA